MSGQGVATTRTATARAGPPSAQAAPATARVSGKNHSAYRLACEICGSLTEIPGDIFGDLIKAARSRYGFTVNPQHFAVTGHCAACEGSCKPWQL